jgi:hypothetical protein
MIFVLLCNGDVTMPVLLRGHFAKQLFEFLFETKEIRMTIGSFEISTCTSTCFTHALLLCNQGKLMLSRKVT